MIFIFIIYLFILFWLFESLSSSDDKILEKNEESSISIIIDQINDINDLLLTIDSIKSQDYDFNKINLILLDSSSNDIKSIVNVYSNIFSSIDVIKTSKINKSETLNSFYALYLDYILFIRSGTCIPKSFISTLSKYLQNSDFSIIFLPLFHKYEDRHQIFYQIYNSFIESIKCSLINKNFYLPDKNLVIKNDSFIAFVNKNLDKNINQTYLMTPELCLYKNKNLNFINMINSDIINFIYLGINLLFILILVQFLAIPSIYLLILIIIKIIPEACFIYIFYNRIRVKFPKLDFLIFSVVGPFYYIIQFIESKVFIKQ